MSCTLYNCTQTIISSTRHYILPTEHLRNMESSALYGMYYVQKVENGPLSYEALATSVS